MSAYKPILGQNFLIDKFVRSRIIKTSSIETNETVIESVSYTHLRAHET